MTAPKSFALDAELHAYLVDHGTPPDDIQRDLIAETASLGGIARMQIAPEQGALMTLLTALLRPRLAVEVGTFTGYSALCIARGLPPGGRLVCCDVSDDWTAIARRYWARAGVEDRIELRIAPALETLAALPADEPIDLAFIDADKANYIAYYDELVDRLSPDGLLLVDNVLWHGQVLDPDAGGDTAAIRAFNDHVVADPRTQVVMLPVADGLSLIRRG